MKSNNNRTEIVTAFTLILGEFFLHKIILTAAINKEHMVPSKKTAPTTLNEVKQLSIPGDHYNPAPYF